MLSTLSTSIKRFSNNRSVINFRSIGTVDGPHKVHGMGLNWRIREKRKAFGDRHRQAKQTMREMTRCKSSQDVLDLYKYNQLKFVDHINFASALYLFGRKRIAKSGVDNFDAGVDNKMLQKILNKSEQHVSRWRSRELSNVAFSLRQIGLNNHHNIDEDTMELVKKIGTLTATQVEAKLKYFTELEFTESMLGLAFVTPKHETVFKAFETRLNKFLGRLYPNHMASITIAAAQIGNKDIAQAICDEFTRRHVEQDDPNLEQKLGVFVRRGRTRAMEFLDACETLEVEVPSYLDEAIKDEHNRVMKNKMTREDDASVPPSPPDQKNGD